MLYPLMYINPKIPTHLSDKRIHKPLPQSAYQLVVSCLIDYLQEYRHFVLLRCLHCEDHRSHMGAQNITLNILHKPSLLPSKTTCSLRCRNR